MTDAKIGLHKAPDAAFMVFFSQAQISDSRRVLDLTSYGFPRPSMPSIVANNGMNRNDTCFLSGRDKMYGYSSDF